ncbi:MAG: DNA modification methylase [Albidovulum sp.]
MVKIDRIKQAPRRIRRAMARQIEAVKDSMRRFGYRLPILIDRKCEVIDGHIRLEAARQLGADVIACIVVDDLPDHEIRRLALSLNKLQEGGEWDDAMLKLEVGELIEIDGDIIFPGFEFQEIEAIRFGENGDDEGADPLDDISGFGQGDQPPVTQTGDLWILGDHRLLCGSARDAEAVDRLLDGRTVRMVLTDPPFNLKVSELRVAVDFPEFHEASGEMDRATFIGFLQETLAHAAAWLVPGGLLYAFIDWRHIGHMEEALGRIGLHILNICVWVKDAAGMGSFYRSQHEFIYVARKPGGRHLNNIQLGRFGRNRSNVWTYADATGGARSAEDDFALHPTVKPVRLLRDAILDCTEPGDGVLDPFVGSGSTLLAAERARRRGFGLEIEPHYVDVAIRRWQQLTGVDAVHAGTGQTYIERAAQPTVPDAPSPTSPSIVGTVPQGSTQVEEF